MQSGKTVTCGVVLRATETKETDSILTVLTADLGKIPVIARGVRRRKSRIAAAGQLLAYSEMTLYKRGNWYMLDEATTLELFDGVRQDLVLLSLASYFAELTEFLTDEGETGEILPLFLNALYALGTLKKDPRLVKAAFEVRLLALSGFAPLCDACAVCGAAEMERPMLDAVRGVVHCAEHKEAGGLSLPLTAAALEALQHAVLCHPKKLYSFSLPPGQLQLFSHAAEAFAAAQLERGFRTLDYYKAILPEEQHI